MTFSGLSFLPHEFMNKSMIPAIVIIQNLFTTNRIFQIVKLIIIVGMTSIYLLGAVLSVNFESHYVIVHVKAITYREVTLTHDLHTQMFIETDG